RRLRNGHLVRRHDEPLRRQGGAVEFQRAQLERLAVEHEGRGRRAVPVGPQRERRTHASRRGVERDIEFHALDQPVGRTVILKTYGAGLFGAPGRSAFPTAAAEPLTLAPARDSVGGGEMVTFLLIYPQFASCFNRFPGSRNPLYGCADNIGRNVMTVFRTLRLGVVALLAATLGAAAPASAQDYPNQRVTIVVPFGAGSVTDIMARILADELSKRWNQQVVVENR